MTEQSQSPQQLRFGLGGLRAPEAQIATGMESGALARAGLRRPGVGSVVASVIAVSLLAGCASSRGPTGERPDPLEPVNRAVFTFNVTVFDYAEYVLDPVTRGYRWVVPEPVRNSVSRFFDNAYFPTRFVASLGQAEGRLAAEELARFAINTTVGIGGLFDPALWLGLEPSEEDIGQMLGAWGVPGGPYIVLPLLGPSNPRDLAGSAVETLFLDPLGAVGGTAVSVASGIGSLNSLAENQEGDEQLDALREAALDYYIAARDAYLDQREQQVENRAASLEEPAAVPEEIYDLEEEETAEDVSSPESGAEDAATP